MTIIDRILVILTFAAAIGAGLVAGVFYAFSTFVMKALLRIQPSAGLAAMQSINVVVLSPWFLGVFMGTALVCIAVAIGAFARWDRIDGAYATGGALLYCIGTLGVTLARNVPLNVELAKVSGEETDAAQRWIAYVERWTKWNHIRTAAAIAAMAALMLVLRRGASS
jgi:uncharacterized membrane protein